MLVAVWSAMMGREAVSGTTAGDGPEGGVLTGSLGVVFCTGIVVASGASGEGEGDIDVVHAPSKLPNKKRKISHLGIMMASRELSD